MVSEDILVELFKAFAVGLTVVSVLFDSDLGSLFGWDVTEGNEVGSVFKGYVVDGSNEVFFHKGSPHIS